MDAVSKRRKGAVGEVLKRLRQELAHRSHTPIGVARSKWQAARGTANPTEPDNSEAATEGAPGNETPVAVAALSYLPVP